MRANDETGRSKTKLQDCMRSARIVLETSYALLRTWRLKQLSGFSGTPLLIYQDAPEQPPEADTLAV